jgi:hypothetical protein
MKALAFLLFLAAAALGGWAWWEHSERLHTADELAAMRIERDRFQKSARESISKLTTESGAEIKSSGPTGLTDQLKDLGITLNDETKKKKPDGESKGDIPGETAPHPEGPDLAKLLKDPGMKQALRAQADAQLEMLYSDLFKEMKLEESKRETVLTILKERQGAQTDLGLSVFDASLSATGRKAVAEKLSTSAKEAEVKLKEALGSEYPAFEQFEKSAPERQQIASLSSLLKEKELTLDAATKKKLMDVMFQERQTFKFDRDLSDLKTVQPDILTEATVDRYMAQNAKLQQQVQAKVKDLLSDEQYGLFLKAQENQQQMAQTHLQWLRELAGNGKEADARN